MSQLAPAVWANLHALNSRLGSVQVCMSADRFVCMHRRICAGMQTRMRVRMHMHACRGVVTCFVCEHFWAYQSRNPKDLLLVGSR